MDFLIPEWLLALALTLFVVDLFLSTEVLSWCGVLSLASYFTWRIGAPLHWRVLVFIGALLLFAALYYWVFRVFVGAAFVRFMQRGAPRETVDAIHGADGRLHFVDGRPMFRWNGDELWPVRNPPPAAVEGMPVRAARLRGGFVELQ